ncbi:hypothetical protein TVNIR_1990 [Thioalkalivibrio nitratireducens DSM 14787]|uniref:Uncharacterized protein n=1 Tax=Thioalkalivibrio nitratireducens (strain DSM 14787 / UNIQEM 213 / ALEN2) TaxID=1255043 RepID=L0DZ51_THIND|nr:hypothetical protein TVNIR_1990 [Thioalkalivibrio nitratireducens DSM 14787]
MAPFGRREEPVYRDLASRLKQDDQIVADLAERSHLLGPYRELDNTRRCLR